MENLYIGIDIGGTNIKCGIINKNGKVFEKSSFKTDSSKKPDKIAQDIIYEVQKYFDKFSKDRICGIGIGIPGLIDTESGIVICSGNLDWSEVDIVTPIKQAFNVSVTVANDANVAALGESKFASGERYNNCVMVTLGTGVGSGIIINGKIFAGVRSAGAEIGHMVIEANGKPCTCGGKGCFEAYSSARALKEMTREAMLNDKNSKMWEIGDENAVSGKTAFLYSEVDESAKKVVEKYIGYLSIGIVNIANIFRPEAIILGGGVSYEGDKLLKPLIKKLDENIFAKGLGPKVKLILAQLRNDAGFMGAAALNM